LKALPCDIATALPTLRRTRPSLRVSYKGQREFALLVTSDKPFICRPFPAVRVPCVWLVSSSKGVAAERRGVNAWGAFRVFVGELEQPKQDAESAGQTGITARRARFNSSNTMLGRNLGPAQIHKKQVQEKDE
jgi:hypothetical protein